MGSTRDVGGGALRAGARVPGLYVADACLLPTSLGVNPMVTIMAMAQGGARGLAAELS